MSQALQLRKYGVEFTVDFELYEVDGVNLRTDWTPAATDCEVMKDGGASTQCTNTATDEGSTYSIVITATEAEAARLVIKVVDAATKAFLDKVIIVETYGNASAQHAFDLDTATQKVDIETIKTKAITAAAAITINPSVGAASIVPTNTQFEARSLPSDGYVVVGDTIAGATTVGSVTTKTGYVLASTGLDSVVMEDLAAVPGVTASIKAAINWVYNICRNEQITNKTDLEIKVKNDAGTIIAEADISDDGTSFTRGKFGTPD